MIIVTDTQPPARPAMLDEVTAARNAAQRLLHDLTTLQRKIATYEETEDYWPIMRGAYRRLVIAMNSLTAIETNTPAGGPRRGLQELG